MTDIGSVILALAHTPWAYVLMAGILVVDGFFPFVPGETAVVTLASVVASGGVASGGGLLWLVLAVAVAGFWFAVNPLRAALVAVAVVFAVSFVLDRLSRRRAEQVARTPQG